MEIFPRVHREGISPIIMGGTPRYYFIALRHKIVSKVFESVQRFLSESCTLPAHAIKNAQAEA
jgi:hypothetical protein